MARMKKLKKKVVIIGGGFGGLYTAKELAHTDFDITVIDKTNHHLFQPLLYQVATAALSPADIGTPIRKILRDHENILVLYSEVTSIDKEKREVHMHNHDPLPYDILIVAVGAMHSYFGHPEWEQNARGLKTLDDALAIRERILNSFEQAELCDSHTKAQQFLNFVVIGGGPTGVELAGAIAEIANHTMLKNFKRIDPRDTKVYLIEGLPRILSSFPEKLSARAHKDLEHLGVEIITGHMVTEVHERGVQIGRRFIKASNIIWAAGNEASPLLKTLGVPLDRQGRVLVEPNLSIPGNPEIFVIGDAANCKGKDGRPLPAVAPVAIQQAGYISKLILKNLTGKDVRPFAYLDKGLLATIGRSRAVAQVFGLEFGGFVAWVIWCFVHLMYLVLHRNRLKVMGDWVYGYFTGQRGARLIRMPSQEKRRKDLYAKTT